MKLIFSFIVLILFSSLGTPVFAFIYWRNDTQFKFSRDGGRLTKCYYQWVSQEVDCPIWFGCMTQTSIIQSHSYLI